jgi:hypothetical protein
MTAALGSGAWRLADLNWCGDGRSVLSAVFGRLLLRSVGSMAMLKVEGFSALLACAVLTLIDITDGS